MPKESLTSVATITQMEKCLKCGLVLEPVGNFGRSRSQLQCDTCAEKELESWLEDCDALKKGEITVDEHEAHIAAQIMACPGLHNESAVEWARARMK